MVLPSSSKISSFPPSPSPTSPQNFFSETLMEDTIQSIINKCNSIIPYSTTSSLFFTHPKEAGDLIQCVHDLRNAMHFYLAQNTSSPNLSLSYSLTQAAIQRLEKEFRNILVSSQLIEGEVTFKTATSDLKLIADCMIKGGYGKACAKVYKTVRKSFIDGELKRIVGIQRSRSFKVMKKTEGDGEVAQQRISSWIRAMNTCVRKVFYNERILCDCMFSASEMIKESCFSETTKDGAVNIFTSGQQIAKTEKSKDCMFKLIDMHSAITAMYPDIESIFSFESTSTVRSNAAITLTKLGYSVSLLLTEFESQLQKHSSKIPLGGGIDPLTKSAMIFISRLASNGSVLSGIISDNHYPEKKLVLLESYYNSRSGEGDSMLLSLRFARLILVLLCNLDKKSETYKDVAFSYLFLTNNLNFIVEEVCRNANLCDILGEDWVSDHKRKVKQFATNYQTAAWSRVLTCLPEKKKSRNLEAEEVKECMKRFKTEFEETRRRQMTWIVVDGRLRNEMKLSIAKKVVGAYREFYEENGVMRLLNHENDETFVRFGAPDDFGNYLSDLFFGT